ncbi:MAG: hypothetical protein ACP5HS_10940 [Anaerolineae bacterium]
METAFLSRWGLPPDSEIATVGTRIFDLAYCSTALLSAAGEDDVRRQMWPKLLQGLVAGYHGIEPLRPLERARFWHVQLAIQLIFIAFFYGRETPDLAAANTGALLWLFAHRDRICGVLEDLQNPGS